MNTFPAIITEVKNFLRREQKVSAWNFLKCIIELYSLKKSLSLFHVHSECEIWGNFKEERREEEREREREPEEFFIQNNLYNCFNSVLFGFLITGFTKRKLLQEAKINNSNKAVKL